MTSTVSVPARFCGPPGTGNGGYTAGLLGRVLDGPVEVTLRRPAPLDRSLAVETTDGVARLLDGTDLVAEAQRTVVDLEVPAPVSFPESIALGAHSPFRDQSIHPFPRCFACGPAREPGDGLRLFPGRVPGTDTYAVGWVPEEVDDLIVWAALDCPSGVLIYLDTEHPPPHVLGRMAVRIVRLPVAGEQHVITSWLRDRDGRKVLTASALHDATGALCALARCTWIGLAPADDRARR